MGIVFIKAHGGYCGHQSTKWVLCSSKHIVGTVFIETHSGHCVHLGTLWVFCVDEGTQWVFSHRIGCRMWARDAY